MFDLLEPIGGALSPLIILLATMMMSGGSSSYSFSGNDADVPFLLIKARATARRLPGPHSRTGGAGWRTTAINFAEFFDLPSKPADIDEQTWKLMSSTAYDCMRLHHQQPQQAGQQFAQGVMLGNQFNH